MKQSQIKTELGVLSLDGQKDSFLDCPMEENSETESLHDSLGLSTSVLWGQVITAT